MNTASPNAKDPNNLPLDPGTGNPQDGNAATPGPTPQDPTSLAQQSAEPVTTGPVNPGHRTPVMARTGLAESATSGPTERPVSTAIGLTDLDPVSNPEEAQNCGHRSCVQGPGLSAIGLSESVPADPHEVRARLTRRGAVHGLELDAGSGVVFIPQHALPDLRRRLLLAQEGFTAMSGPVPGKRRRRPASAR